MGTTWKRMSSLFHSYVFDSTFQQGIYLKIEIIEPFQPWIAMMEKNWMSLITMLSLNQVVGKQKEPCAREIKKWVLETCEEDSSTVSYIFQEY